MEKISELKDYQQLISVNKDEIRKRFGHEFNFYPSSTWSYIIKKNFWGMKKILIIEFKNEEVSSFRFERKF